jgi:hypothetical protein
MTLPGWTRTIAPLGWLLILGALVLCMVAFWWFVLAAPARHRAEAARAKAGQIVAERNASAGKDAIGVVVGNQKGQSAIDQSVKEGTDAIRQVPEDQRNAATLRALCLRDAHRRDPACRELR